MNKKNKLREIEEFLKSIQNIKVSSLGQVDIYFEFEGQQPFSATEYKRGSFVREFIELVERHVSK